MSSFTAGFTARHSIAAEALHKAFSLGERVFAPSDIKQRAGQPRSFSPEAGPKHFAPADAGVNPTEGWDPFAADAGHEEPPAATNAFVDPIRAARDMGYAEGKAAGLAEAASVSAHERQLIESLAAGLRAAGQIDREGMAARLRQTVMMLVGRLVGEIGIDGQLLATRVEAATDMLADSAESALLRVNPQDVPLLEGRLPTTVFAAGDASVARGSFVLESASTIIEDGPDLWLEQLSQAIDRVALPRG